MKKIAFWFSLALISIFWPISIITANVESWPTFLSLAAILIVDWFLYIRHVKYHYFIYLLIPLIHPALLIFPLIAFLLNVNEIKKPLIYISYSVIFVAIVIFSFKSFHAYSIFTPDPLAQDTLIKKISVVPNRNLAKIFENKTTIAQEKYKSNIFLSLDLNNYFFSLHPRELVGENQNLAKFPYLAIFPFLIGIFFIPENKHKKWIISSFVAAALSLGFINNQDKFDFLMFMPIFLICFYGLRKIFDSNKYALIFSLLFIPATLIELARILVFK